MAQARYSPAIAVVGAGAIGGWIAAKLALAGERVNLLARGETLRLIQSDGLLLSDQSGDQTVSIPVFCDPEEIGKQDLVVLAMKAPALPAVAASLRPIIGPDTLIVPMLNGVPWWLVSGEPLESTDPGGKIATALPLARIIGCVIHASASRSAPNYVVVHHADKLILGEPRGDASERVRPVADMFERAGIRVETSENVRRAIWYKLWGNATINPISALTRATADRILADKSTRAFMLEAMGELAAVGAAIGCPIEESGEDRMAVTARLGAFKSSMLQDVEAGRPIELEALLGAPREIARRIGIATPALDRLYGLTRLMGESLDLV